MEIKDLAGLSKPLTKLIEVISKGIGNISEPMLIRKKADAKAYEIKQISQAINDVNIVSKNIEYSEGKIKVVLDQSPLLIGSNEPIVEKTIARLIHKEIKKQSNIENTINIAFQNLEEETTVSNEAVDDDWITRFFDIAEDISNEQMQNLWGRILSGEIKKPKTYSLRTLDILKNITFAEAEIFRKVSQYSLKSGDKTFLLHDDEYFENSNITFSDLLLLSDLGLIFPNQLEFSFSPLSKYQESHLIYGSTIILFKRDEDTIKIPFNVNVYTQVGKESLNLLDISFNSTFAHRS
jgi:hypothetical protein